MDIKKIYVTVDHKDYSGLYWISETDSFFSVTVSFESINNTSGPLPKESIEDNEHIAKKMLFDLITKLK